MTDKRYKVLRDGLNWSLGYPTRTSAEAAARRLGRTAPAKFTAAEMSPVDYKILASLEVEA